GLSLLTPLLVPWVAHASRPARVLAAAGLWLVPILSTWPLGPDGEPVGAATVAWTWWLPYLGAYLMGEALHGVVLPRRWVAHAVAAVLGLTALLVWQWQNPKAPAWLETWVGAHYYGPSVAVLCVLVLLLAQTTVRPGGALAVL